jgi:hypothetical protein
MKPLAVAMAITSLSACGPEEDDSASFSLNISDAPIDSATAVYVQFTGVELKPSEGSAIEFNFDAPKTINLLALQEGRSEPLVSSEEIDAGSYDWMRLKVNAQNMVIDSYIEFEDGTQYSLYIPSGSQTGLKLVRGFNVAVGQSADFTIDFDLRKSIVDPKGANADYFLKPALRVVDNTEIGEVAGSVSNTTMEAGDCLANGAVVYVFEGLDVNPDDLGSLNEPLVTANVNYDASLNIYDYVVPFLAPGDFTAALTCQATIDAPEADEELLFIEALNTSVEADQTVTLNFQ